MRYTPEDASRTDFSFLVRACNSGNRSRRGPDQFRRHAGDPAAARNVRAHHAICASSLLPCKIDLHCHNDYGLALANALAGIRAGADCIHTTVNGMGERTGIPDLCETILALRNLMGMEKYDLRADRAFGYLERVSGFFLAPNKPVTGMNAFSHKSGVHTNGVLKDPRTYENFDPALIGRERRIVIDKYTGQTRRGGAAGRIRCEGGRGELDRIVEEIKQVGDERKILHDADIVEVAERVTGHRIDVFPKDINALMMIAVDSHVYTGAVVRRLKILQQVSMFMRSPGDYDISAYVKVPNTMDLNNFIEELRASRGSS